MNKIFSENLKQKRKEKGFTQEIISERLKIKRSRYAAWEEARAFPAPSMLIRICEVLGVDDLYLFLSKSLAVKC